MLKKPKIKVLVENYEKHSHSQKDDQSKSSDCRQNEVPRTKLIHKKKKDGKHKQQQQPNTPQAAEFTFQQEVIQQHQPIQQSNIPQVQHVAVCLPDSLVSIPQSSVIRSYFLGELARICSIFRVDEIIVLRDHTYTSKSDQFNPSEYMVRNLQYLETPQYLRKHLFEIHSDLKNAGLMNPLECDHHLKADQMLEFREGVVLDRPSKHNSGSWVQIGLKQQAKINYTLPAKTRVTVKITNYTDPAPKFYEAQAVSRTLPRQQKNLYWGYNVRLAKNLKHIFKTQQPYTKKILINHRPTSQSEGLQQINHLKEAKLAPQDRLLLLFSGYQPLESMVSNDERCKLTVKELLEMLDYSLILGKYGVKNLRIQEQLFITLGQLQ